MQNSPRNRRRMPLAVEPLEGRRVLSHAPTSGAIAASVAHPGGDGSGAGAIMNALGGGAGGEFVTLLRRSLPNPSAVLRQFANGTRTEVDVKGFAAKIPRFQPSYRGPQLDQFDPTAAGAVILRDGRLELAAIMRGPIDLPVATTYRWAIDRGAGTPDPQGLGLPGLAYDAVVSVSRVGTNVSATIADLKAGSTTVLDPSAVNIQGPTIRVTLANPSTALPSTGLPTSSYRFTFWTSDGSAGAASIGGFVPGSGMLQVGSLAAIPHRKGPR